MLRLYTYHVTYHDIAFGIVSSVLSTEKEGGKSHFLFDKGSHSYKLQRNVLSCIQALKNVSSTCIWHTF